jgi:hypothetical protein
VLPLTPANVDEANRWCQAQGFRSGRIEVYYGRLQVVDGMYMQGRMFVKCFR